MIHIVFQQADAHLLNETMKLDESLRGEIVELKEDWGVGPVKDVDTEEGWTARVNWWRQLLAGSPYGEKVAGRFDDRETIHQLKEKLTANEQSEVWIWMGQNQHDVTGYYWLISRLSDYQGRILLLFLNNLPFLNEKGQLFYPRALHDILPKEVIKAKKLARPVTLSEFETDADEWLKIKEENAPIRILEGGKKIVGKEETFYDNELLKNLTPEWQKATRILSNTLHRMKIKTSDVFLMWRMKQLIAEGKAEVLGNIQGAWKEFDIRKSANLAAQSAQATEENNQ